mgnify:FL=1
MLSSKVRKSKQGLRIFFVCAIRQVSNCRACAGKYLPGKRQRRALPGCLQYRRKRYLF